MAIITHQTYLLETADVRCLEFLLPPFREADGTMVEK